MEMRVVIIMMFSREASPATRARQKECGPIAAAMGFCSMGAEYMPAKIFHQVLKSAVDCQPREGLLQSASLIAPDDEAERYS
jgi:hypothetical protein